MKYLLFLNSFQPPHSPAGKSLSVPLWGTACSVKNTCFHLPFFFSLSPPARLLFCFHKHDAADRLKALKMMLDAWTRSLTVEGFYVSVGKYTASILSGWLCGHVIKIFFLPSLFFFFQHHEDCGPLNQRAHWDPCLTSLRVKCTL